MLKDELTQEYLDKSVAYEICYLKKDFARSVAVLLENAIYYKYDVYSKLWSLSGSLLQNYVADPKSTGNVICQSLIVFALLKVEEVIRALPFAYKGYLIESQFGFTKFSTKSWLVDWLKSVFMNNVVAVIPLALLLWIMESFEDNFPIYATLSYISLQTYLVVLNPIFMKLFYTVNQLEDGELKSEIQSMARKLNFPISEISVIGASEKSSHSGAQFVGLPWTSKEIYIFDTLIQHSSRKEIVAVCCHELGHWKLGHTHKLLLSELLGIFIKSMVFSGFYHNKSLFESFAFPEAVLPSFIALCFYQEVANLPDMLLAFSENYVSRKYEREADLYAVRMNYKTEIATALINLEKNNFSSGEGDWFYNAYIRSHPTLVERLKNVGYKLETKIA